MGVGVGMDGVVSAGWITCVLPFTPLPAVPTPRPPTAAPPPNVDDGSGEDIMVTGEEGWGIRDGVCGGGGGGERSCIGATTVCVAVRGRVVAALLPLPLLLPGRCDVVVLGTPCDTVMVAPPANTGTPVVVVVVGVSCVSVLLSESSSPPCSVS